MCALETIWTAAPLRGINLGDRHELSLGKGLDLINPDERLIPAVKELDLVLSKTRSEAINRADCFLVLRVHQSPLHTVNIPESVELLLDALMAFQIVKPVETYGLVFTGTESSNGHIRWHGTDDRGWAMSAGQWARLRIFDEPFLSEVQGIVDQVRKVMTGPDVAKRNAIHLLQLALEHPHPYIACLLAVTGIEAIIGCNDRWDFESKLCDFLGPSALAFPDWNSPHFQPLKYKVKDLAVHLYTLRSKIAHGANLASAAQDKNSPVNLAEFKEYIPEGEPVSYAILLCESSIYLLGQVLQKSIRQSLEASQAESCA